MKMVKHDDKTLLLNDSKVLIEKIETIMETLSNNGSIKSSEVIDNSLIDMMVSKLVSGAVIDEHIDMFTDIITNVIVKVKYKDRTITVSVSLLETDIKEVVYGPLYYM